MTRAGAAYLRQIIIHGAVQQQEIVSGAQWASTHLRDCRAGRNMMQVVKQHRKDLCGNKEDVLLKAYLNFVWHALICGSMCECVGMCRNSLQVMKSQMVHAKSRRNLCMSVCMSNRVHRHYWHDSRGKERNIYPPVVFIIISHTHQHKQHKGYNLDNFTLSY